MSDRTDLGSALLRAGRDEWPSDEALSRTLHAVAAGAAVVAVTSGVAAGTGASVGTVAKGGAALLTFGSVVKWLGVGVVSGALVAGVAHEITPSVHAPSVPAPIVEKKPPLSAVPTAVPKSEPELGSVPAPLPEVPKPATPVRSVAKERLEAPEHGVPLAAEVALVDRARASIAGGRPGQALTELIEYERAFPEPRLEPEVLFLRMEAYLALGDAKRARETAEESVRRFPRGPHAARARQLIDEEEEAKKK